jgi:hypothetical protein
VEIEVRQLAEKDTKMGAKLNRVDELKEWFLTQ